MRHIGQIEGGLTLGGAGAGLVRGSEGLLTVCTLGASLASPWFWSFFGEKQE